MSKALTNEFAYRCLASFDPDPDAPKMAVFMSDVDDMYLSKDVVETLLMPYSEERSGNFQQELLMAWGDFDEIAPKF